MAEKTTTHYAFPYPTSVGEVKLGGTNIGELAIKLDEVLFEKNLGSIQVAAGAVYSAQVTTRTVGVEYEPSATRPTFVSLELTAAAGAGRVTASVGGVRISSMSYLEGVTFGFSLIVPPALKWKFTNLSGANPTIASSYLSL
jgi:hypothetical protein